MGSGRLNAGDVFGAGIDDGEEDDKKSCPAGRDSARNHRWTPGIVLRFVVESYKGKDAVGKVQIARGMAVSVTYVLYFGAPCCSSPSEIQ